MSKELPDKLKKDLAACKFRQPQRRVPYPSGALGHSLTARGGSGSEATMEGKHKAERKLLEEILGREPAAALPRMSSDLRGLQGLAAAQQQQQKQQQQNSASTQAGSSSSSSSSSIDGGVTDENAGAAGRRSSSSNSSSGGSGGIDLLGSMASRLATVEAANKRLTGDAMAQNKELLQVQREAAALRSALEDAEAANGATGRDTATLLDEVAHLQGQNDGLREQLVQMHSFLDDYGLKWVGGGDQASKESKAEPKSAAAAAVAGGGGGGSSSTWGAGAKLGSKAAADEGGASEEQSEGKDGAAAAAEQAEGKAEADDAGENGGAGEEEPAGRAGFRFDVERFVEELAKLNVVAGESVARIVQEQQAGGMVHKFKYPDGLPLTLYEDGLFLRRGPFRGFGGAHTQAFVRDVCDGYFPSEFRAEFPEGVVLRLTDRRAEPYGGGGGGGGAGFRAFGGEGNSLASGGGGGGGGGGTGRVTSLSSVGGSELPLSRDQFLAALPASVVGASGNVVSVRNSIAGMLDGPGPAGPGGCADAHADAKDCGADGADIVVETQGAAAVAAAAAEGSSSSGGAQTDAPVATLRVRSDDGRQALMLKMRCDETVGDLVALIDSRRGGAQRYELRTAFPNRVHSDMALTLEQAGLTPNAQLMLRILEAKQ